MSSEEEDDSMWEAEDDDEDLLEIEMDVSDAVHMRTEEQKPEIIKRIDRGEFGFVDNHSFAAPLLRERLINGVRPKIMHRYVPSQKVGKIKLEDTGYAGQFSQDGLLYWSGCKDLVMRVYSTANVYEPELISAHNLVTPGQWTLTDGAMTSDNKYLAFSSMSPDATLINLHDKSRSSLHFGSYGSIFSLEFSADDTRIAAGMGDGTVRVLHFDAAIAGTNSVIGEVEDDVNCVTFVDDSPNLILSGSDDNQVILWDTRQAERAGVFLGHTEGITGLDSRKDGKYFITNGKDQCLKLWDMRKAMSADFAEMFHGDYATGYDYRWDNYHGPRLRKHPNDCSVMTYGGHAVARTLIRCYFSPEYTSKQYIYSGSADGKLYIWHLNGERAEVVDGKAVVLRDVAWHPHQPSVYCSGNDVGYGCVLNIAHAPQTCLHNIDPPHVV